MTLVEGWPKQRKPSTVLAYVEIKTDHAWIDFNGARNENVLTMVWVPALQRHQQLGKRFVQRVFESMQYMDWPVLYFDDVSRGFWHKMALAKNFGKHVTIRSFMGQHVCALRLDPNFDPWYEQ